MAVARSKITSQGQISVPAEIRRRLGVGPGSMLEWVEGRWQRLVKLIVQDDRRQFEAAKAFVEDGAWASVLAVAETAWVLTHVYGLSGADVATAIEMLSKSRSIVLQHADAIEHAVALFRARPGLGFSDCLMLELARKAGHLPLGTFDRALSRVAGAQRL